MEKVAIRHTCSHLVIHHAHGDPSAVSRYASQLTRQECPDCQWRHAREYARARGLPDVTWGSDRQIAWAEVIRARVLQEIDRCMTEPQPAQREAVEQLARCARARYWISRRRVDPAVLVEAWARPRRETRTAISNHQRKALGADAIGTRDGWQAINTKAARWCRTLVAIVGRRSADH